MEKTWPPLKECLQFKLDLMNAALYRYPWEDDKYAFDFNSYYPPIPEELASLRKLLDAVNKKEFGPEDIRYCPFCRLHPDPRGVDVPNCLAYYYDKIPVGKDILNDPVWDMDPIPCPIHLFEHVWQKTGRGPPLLFTPTQLEDTKKYLNQVRNSRGYDVDCVPHLVTPEFWNFDLNGEVGRSIKNRMKRELDATAIVDINKKTDKVYELEDVLKIVSTQIRLYLVTFTAKVKNDDSAALETFIATTAPNNVLEECLLKPDCDAPGPEHYPDFIIHPIQVPEFYMKRHAAPLCSRKRPGKHYPTVSKRLHTMTPMTPPNLEDSQCTGGWKASSQAFPVIEIIRAAPKELPMCYYSVEAKPLDKKFKSKARFRESKFKPRARSRESIHNSQAGVTLPTMFPLQPVEAEPLQDEGGGSMFPLQPVEAEPLQDEGGGSNVYVEETSPNPEAVDTPSPLN